MRRKATALTAAIAALAVLAFGVVSATAGSTRRAPQRSLTITRRTHRRRKG